MIADGKAWLVTSDSFDEQASECANAERVLAVLSAETESALHEHQANEKKKGKAPADLPSLLVLGFGTHGSAECCLAAVMCDPCDRKE
jgi:hypothetical protein